MSLTVPRFVNVPRSTGWVTSGVEIIDGQGVATRYQGRLSNLFYRREGDKIRVTSAYANIRALRLKRFYPARRLFRRTEIWQPGNEIFWDYGCSGYGERLFFLESQNRLIDMDKISEIVDAALNRKIDMSEDFVEAVLSPAEDKVYELIVTLQNELGG